MKKQLAWIVAMGMVFSAAGCEKNASDTSTATTSPAASSSETTSEDATGSTTDGVSETTESETSQTSKAIDKTYSLVKHDLEYLPLRITKMDEQYYGKPVKRVLHDEFDYDATYEATFYPTILLYSEQMVFDGSAYSELQEKVDEVLNPGLEKLKKEHAGLVSSFKGGKDPYPNMEYAHYVGSQEIKLFRADSQILSFRVNTHFASAVDLTYGVYSFDAKTAEPIRFDDVVKDKVALMELVEAELDEDLKRMFVSVEDALNEIKDGSVAFGLTYDGICLYPGVENRGSIMLKVSALAHPELFNQEYFGHTPENYSLFTFSLQSDPQEKSLAPDMEWELDQALYWDFNEDGKLDRLSATRSTGMSLITLMNMPSAIVDDCRFLTFVETKDGQYLFAEGYSYEGRSYAVQSDGQLQEITPDLAFRPTNRYMVNPDRFETEVNSIYLSCAFFLTRNAAISKGKVMFPDTIVRYVDGERVKSDFTAKKYDITTGTIGEDIVIKKDSYLVTDLFYEEEENSKIVCRVYELDSEEFIYVALLSDDGLFSISGKDFSEIVEINS